MGCSHLDFDHDWRLPHVLATYYTQPLPKLRVNKTKTCLQVFKFSKNLKEKKVEASVVTALFLTNSDDREVS